MQGTGVTGLLGIVALGIGTALLFLGGPDYESPRVFGQFWNNGHLLYFALLTSLMLQLPRMRRLRVAQQWGIILAFTLLAGGMIELLQQLVQRSAEPGDLVRDIAGSLLALAFAPATRAIANRTGLRTLQLAVVAGCVWLLLPLARSLLDEAIALWQFPRLAGFETPFEIDRWGQRPDLAVVPAPAGASGSSLLIPLTTARYSGAGLRYFPGDWRGYRRLLIDFYNPDKAPLRLTCRIHDLAHTRGPHEYSDRYNGQFELQRGWNRISIDLREVAGAPDGRAMDMAHIRGAGCFATSLPAPRRLYADNLRLER